MKVNVPSRAELISWVNNLTNAGIQRLQDLSNAVQFCQIFDKMYPKIINLHKLKKDAKFPLEKEKNFRILLNAINQIGLSVKINIADLGQGKVTQILELLQWMHKQYHHPSINFGIGHQNQSKLSQPSIFRSYVGNLVNRKQSCTKDYQKKNELGKQSKNGKSLDMKKMEKRSRSQSCNSLMPKQNQNVNIVQNNKEDEQNDKNHDNQIQEIQFKSEKKNLIKTSQTQFKNNSKPKTHFDIDSFKQRQNQLKEEMKKKKTQKKQKQSKERAQDVLREVFSLSNSAIKKTFIEVTQSILETNPELKQKIQRLVNTQVRDQRNYPVFSSDQQVSSLLQSYTNSSLRPQVDNSQRKQSNMKNAFQIYPSLSQNLMNQKKQQKPEGNLMNFDKKSYTVDKKETVKKASVKTAIKLNQQNNFLLSHEQINHISGKKQKEIYQNQDQILQNFDSKQISNVFDPHRGKQRFDILQNQNPEKIEIVEENEKSKQQEETQFHEMRRQAQSQNLSIGNAANSQNVWRYQNFSQQKKPTD